MLTLRRGIQGGCDEDMSGGYDATMLSQTLAPAPQQQANFAGDNLVQAPTRVTIETPPSHRAGPHQGNYRGASLT